MLCGRARLLLLVLVPGLPLLIFAVMSWLYFFYCVLVKRLHDLDRGDWPLHLWIMFSLGTAVLRLMVITRCHGIGSWGVAWFGDARLDLVAVCGVLQWSTLALLVIGLGLSAGTPGANRFGPASFESSEKKLA